MSFGDYNFFTRQDNVVEIESEKGQWTTIRLTLPKISKGAIH